MAGSPAELLGGMVAEGAGAGGRPREGAPAPTAQEKGRETTEDTASFEKSGLDEAERGRYDAVLAARVAGAPFKDPPAIRGRAIREDRPHYITRGLVKIFQTGKEDFWAHQKARKLENNCDVSLMGWAQHVLRWRDGRALRHPRF